MEIEGRTWEGEGMERGIRAIKFKVRCGERLVAGTEGQEKKSLVSSVSVCDTV